MLTHGVWQIWPWDLILNGHWSWKKFRENSTVAFIGTWKSFAFLIWNLSLEEFQSPRSLGAEKFPTCIWSQKRKTNREREKFDTILESNSLFSLFQYGFRKGITLRELNWTYKTSFPKFYLYSVSFNIQETFLRVWRYLMKPISVTFHFPV